MTEIELAEFEKRLREWELTTLEAYRKGTADAPTLYKPSGYYKAAGEGGLSIFVASEESEDRHGDMVSVAGWDTENFKRNPVFMFSHDYSVAPIGTVPKLWTEGKQLLNTVNWDDGDEMAKFIRGKYERRVMRAESVGFRPLEFEENDTKGIYGKGIHFKKQELLEISAVSIPAHPKALQKAMGTRKFGIVVPELPDIFEVKSGSVLNKANRDKLSQAAALIGEVMQSAEKPAEPAPAAPDPPPKQDNTPPPEADLTPVADALKSWKSALSGEAK